MSNQKTLIYLEDAVSVIEQEVAANLDALNTASHGDKNAIQNEIAGQRVAISLIKGLARNGSIVNAIHPTPDYKPGDVCLYIFDNGNKSSAVVEIVRVLNEERGVAEVKFLKVFVDDTGNGFFDYLLKTNQTMNASFQYLKNITPR